MEKVLAEKYELQEQIGQGGSGIVYLAFDRHLERLAAVKAEELPKDASDRGMLRKEMEILKALKHPMLPAIYDYFCEDRQYLAMEYIQGESLYDFLKREGAVSEELACAWGMQLLDLFSYLHGLHPPIIYRDLKPQNIILCPDGKLRVVDFGAAFCFHYGRQMPEQLAGTIGYAAPEQLAGITGYMAVEQSGREAAGICRVDVRSDIYTFGATLYHMLTGYDPSMPPYGIRQVRQMNPSSSAKMEWIVAKCTQKEPENRYQSVEEIKRDLSRRKIPDRSLFPIHIGRRDRQVLKRMERQIWLTEKKSRGLIGLGMILCSILFGISLMQVKGKEAPLPVVVYNEQGQKLVIRYDSVYTPQGNLIFELGQELFAKEGIQKLSVSLTDCTTGKMQERIIYLSGGGEKQKE